MANGNACRLVGEVTYCIVGIYSFDKTTDKDTGDCKRPETLQLDKKWTVD
ncbi:hypothetical protein [Marinoscillum furvescens]|uniref:Uncharacterized protein n=1 Tax=Marinoscillum furvescens DSM 4134 TaxID=1122208 RepID=A0A3D9L0I4_MARFU|nr:hypothetical protein [Marinoscillum furvescens]RED95949.1 hypothetical protein C7460_1167 [Marinoscillum furvescens DSM 4134]